MRLQLKQNPLDALLSGSTRFASSKTPMPKRLLRDGHDFKNHLVPFVLESSLHANNKRPRLSIPLLHCYDADLQRIIFVVKTPSNAATDRLRPSERTSRQ